MQPTLFVVGTLADINFVHTILEAIEINVTASELYKVNKIRYNYTDKGKTHKEEHKDKKVNLSGCIFSLPSNHPFHILSECIIGNIEGQCLCQEFKVKFYYNIAQVDELSDIISFSSGDATFSSFLKTCSQYNTLVKDYK
ncbi:hypothetical protein D7B42_03310 [Salmonella enterica]|nr:hypothetical protein [Salmonella enterica]